MTHQITDPLGRSITLHDRTWFGHILRGHPEMEPYRALVESAISTPTTIRHSNSVPDCRLYFAPGPRPDIMVMVVADIVQGLIKTAHLARKVTGGPEEWSQQTP